MAKKKAQSGKKGDADAQPAKKKRRVYVKQSTIPRHSLRDALTIAQCITDNFAGDPTPPHQVAMALDISPTSSVWKSLAGAAVGYGLTKGAHNAANISLTALGTRCTAPTEEGDDVVARCEAALTPKLGKQFFGKYDRAKFPSDTIAKNVLQQTFNVPADRVDESLQILKDNGAFVGIIHNTKTGPFVSTDSLSPSPVTLEHEPDDPAAEESDAEAGPTGHDEATPPPVDVPIVPAKEQQPLRVFITHGKNKKILEQVKDVLELYDIDYEVAVEEESPAIPVSQKVLTAMRKCHAGIMIVSADDDKAAESGTINNNVLIEIGAAFVLYDQQVVLLWDKDLPVPSNLQGLYRCEFIGNELSFPVGTKLAKAIKGFRAKK